MSPTSTEDQPEFNDDELLRYSRHVLLPQIDIAGQRRLQQAHVLMVGAGGLGCPVGLYLGAAGVGRLTIVDGDGVELSNLQRQIGHPMRAIGMNKAESLAARIAEINPLVNAKAIPLFLDADSVDALVQAADVVVDCSDNFGTRFLLNASAVRHKKPLVSGAAIRGEGQLAVFRADLNSRFDLNGRANLNNRAEVQSPAHSPPCYACVYPDAGDDGDSCAHSGVLSPVVGVIGALQAVETLKVLTQAPPAATHLLVFDAWSGEFRRLKLRRDPACRVCG